MGARAFAAALTLLLAAGAAEAQTPERLVSNIEQTRTSDTGTGGPDTNQRTYTLGQIFTTGDRKEGYTLSGVEAKFYSRVDQRTRVSIWTVSGDPGGGTFFVPAKELYKLTTPALVTTFEGTRINTFAAPSGARLDANTSYAVVFQGAVAAGALITRIATTDSSDLDPGAESGWSMSVPIERRRDRDGTLYPWALESFGRPLQIAIRGAPATPVTEAQVKHTLAAVAARTVADAQDAIGARMGDAVPDSGLALAGRPVPFGGAGAAGPDCAAGCGGAHSRGMDAGELLGSSAFSLALGAAEEEPGFDPAALRWGVWGKGDYGSFEGKAGAHYKGDMRTGWIGADARAGRWVAGLAVSRGTSETDYGGGRLETALTAFWPYGRWTFGDGLELRGLVGAGRGTARHRTGDGASEKSRLTMRAGALGVRQAFAPLDGFDLAARADASFARMETGRGEEAVDGLSADTWRLRGGLEASRRFALKDNATLSPFAELAARRDGGNGVTGSGIELAGGLRYAAAGVSVEARGRWLAAHSEKGVRERGLSATVRLDPEAGGRGLSLALTPRWGASAGGAGALWREEAPQASGASEDAGALDARLGYGFALAPEAGGLLTPFAETGLAGADDRRLRLGTRFEARGGALALELAGERRESAAARPEHTVRLELRAGF